MQRSKKRSGRAVRRPRAAKRWIAVVLWLATFGAASSFASTDQGGELYYYAGGERIALELDPAWVAIRVAPAAAEKTVVRLRGRFGDLLDSGRQERWLAGGELVRLPIRAGVDPLELSRRLTSSMLRGSNEVDGAWPALRHARTGGVGSPLVLTDELVVRFPAGTRDLEQRLAAWGLRLIRPLGVAPTAVLAQVEERSPLAAIRVSARLVEAGEVVYAHPDLYQLRETREYVPDDPLFGDQWHLKATGQGGALVGADVSAPGAWAITLGEPEIAIAVIDSGVDLSHPDLDVDGKLLAGFDVIDDDTTPQDGNGHGTSVAGLAAAAGDNARGVVGVCPRCSIIPIRLVGWFQRATDEADALVKALELGADVVNNSWGVPDGYGDQPLPDVVREAIDRLVTEGRNGLGTAIFWAAGNGNESVEEDGYAAYEPVFAVAASNNQDLRSSYSDFGESISFCAPSSDGYDGNIVTTDIGGNGGYDRGDYTYSFGGTSAASPIAAGVGALVLSVAPDLAVEQLREILQSTADPFEPDGGHYDALGHSEFYGYGRLDAEAAVAAAMGTASGPPRLVFEEGWRRVVAPAGGEQLTRLSVRNLGADPLEIRQLRVDGDPAFVLDDAPDGVVTLERFRRLELTVRFVPSATGQRFGRLWFASNDPERPLAGVLLEGGTRETLLSEDGESGGEGWSMSGGFALVEERAASPTHAFSDSPGGDYAANADARLMSPPLPLRGVYDVRLSFRHFYQTEAGYDLAQVEASPDGDARFAPLAQFDGQSSGFETADLALEALCGVDEGRVRFRLTADDSRQSDGWFVDDIAVSGLVAEGGWPGDVTQDCTLEMTDARQLADWLVGLRELDPDARLAADVVRDGVLDTLDLAALAAGAEGTIPLPLPADQEVLP